MKRNRSTFTLVSGLILAVLLNGCSSKFLDEIPLDRFSPENFLVDEAGFEAATVALYRAARQEHVIGGNNFDYMNLGTDLVEWGRYDSRGFKDYHLLNSQHAAVEGYWRWAYEDMIRQCNLILETLDDPEVQLSDEARKNFEAQAKFFRGYTYNVLATLYGGVPIVADVISEPKFDFQRSSKEEVLQFVRQDLEDASALLPIVGSVSDGRIYKAAAFHLLSEVYISLGMETNDASYFDRAIGAASKVIDGEAGEYQIMIERFGDLSRPGDVFSDLFYTNQQNRASGNMEVIWSLQFESFTLGGGATFPGGNTVAGNNTPRWWFPEQEKIRTPNGSFNIAADSLLRGIGVNSPLNYLKYDIWRLDPDDMRNSPYNIRRVFYYNNPDDPEYFGKPIRTALNDKGQRVIARKDGTLTNFVVDTLREYYPWIRKADGNAFEDNIVGGQSENDLIQMRLAETYLLRAEAYFRKGDLPNAAIDINVLRRRAQAILINPEDVTIDFLLDERARELVMEEPRRRTLARMGVLYERVKTYNPSSATSIQPHHELWPIPQSVIDSNKEAEMDQNDGY
ncbi:RagB/SusD family nutrient uptake outer membrane protein [Parapedobacter sp. GCM10030251]|uniref:RagB/SusD family nutrient uptake outer membrane protein n=1 Tax=Parapedobacter sp. GCM10030251 TaxID=3273419 RepID=UPI003619FC3A